MFEIGPIFEPRGNDLPLEPRRLALVITGARRRSSWDVKDSATFDFFDMKGRLEILLSGLHLGDAAYAETESPNALHPGKSAQVKVNGQTVGIFGELHPLVKDKYDFGDASVIVAEFDLDLLRTLNPTYGIVPVPEAPAIFEDIAVIVDDSVAASVVETLIRQTGAPTVTDVRL